MKHENGTFTLTKADTRALLSCMGRDPLHPTRGVHFEPESGSVVTSDGASLMHVDHSATGVKKPSFTVPPDVFERVAKSLKRKGDRVRVWRNPGAGEYLGSPDGESITLAPERPVKGFLDQWEPIILTEDANAVCEPVSAVFPPFRAVTPPEYSGTEGVVRERLNLAFNPEYLLRAKLMCDACEPRVYGIRWSIPAGSLDPIRADCDRPADGITWRLVVMPMRI